MKTVLKRASPFLLSLLLHSAAVLLVFNLQNASGGKGEGDEEGGGQNGATNEEIRPKTVEITIQEPPPDLPDDIEAEIPKPPEPPKEAFTECEQDAWYGGIGIHQDFLTGLVERVETGYPAYKAGLRIGDQIRQVSSNEGPEIRGTPGTEVQLWVFRPSTNESFLLKIIRDKICTWKKKGEP